LFCLEAQPDPALNSAPRSSSSNDPNKLRGSEKDFSAALNQAQVTDGLLCVRGLANFLDRRHDKRDQYRDDRDLPQPAR